MTTLLEKTASLVARTAKVAHDSLEIPGVTQTPTSSATQVIWQDPVSYDPYLHGPPYLPSTRMKAASEVFTLLNVTPDTGLSALLVFLRAVAQVHQAHHWVAKGSTAFSDHLLFERLYNNMLPEIDAVAERAVGSGGSTVGDFRAHAQAVVRVLDSLGGPGEDLIAKSLEAEELLKFGLSKVVEHMEMSRGTDNLIAGIEDKHEEHVYLLKQRTEGTGVTSV